MQQHDIDLMMAKLDAPPGGGEHSEDVLDLTEQMAAPAEAESPTFRTIDGNQPPDVVTAAMDDAVREASLVTAPVKMTPGAAL